MQSNVRYAVKFWVPKIREWMWVGPPGSLFNSPLDLWEGRGLFTRKHALVKCKWFKKAKLVKVTRKVAV